jgi:hypothetical protein
MRKVSGLIGVTMLLGAPAFAADLGVRAPVMPVEPVPVGGNVGRGWSDQPVNFSGNPGLIGPLIASGVVACQWSERRNWRRPGRLQLADGGASFLASRPILTPRLSPRASPLRLSVLRLIGSQTRIRSSTF